MKKMTTYSTYLPRCEVVQTKQRYLVVRLNFVIIWRISKRQREKSCYKKKNPKKREKKVERNTGETLVLTAYRALCYNQDISQKIFKEHQKGLDAL